jgi:integrase/recombinase XerD
MEMTRIQAPVSQMAAAEFQTPVSLGPASATDWPTPAASTVDRVRQSLGRRRAPGETRRAGVPTFDRLDLLADSMPAHVLGLVIEWLSASGSDNTRRAYADDLLSWADWSRADLGRPFALDLTRSELTGRVSTWQLAEVAASSINRRISALSSLYRYAEGYGLPVESPITAQKSHRPKVKRGRKATSAHVYSARDIDRLAEAARDDLARFVIRALYRGALRVSELVSANDADVTSNGQGQCSLTIVGKGDTEAEDVPLSRDTCEALDAYRASRPEWTGEGPAPLLVNGRGERLTRHDVTWLLRRDARAAGLQQADQMTPHALRASAITHLLEQGYKPTEVMVISRHKSLDTMAIYVDHSGREKLVREMTERLSR